MSFHGKKELHIQISELAKVEFYIRPLQPWVRDHVIHAILSFLLGIYINTKFISNPKVDKFQWKLAGLFHDVGYPIEIAKDMLNPISKIVNDHKNYLDINRPDIEFQIIPKNIEKLQNNNSFELIQKQLDKWNLDINVKNEYENILQSRKFCHGIISSLLVLYYIDCLYNKYNEDRVFEDIRKNGGNWNQLYFENDVVPACSAIFIHNLPKRCFEGARINRKKAPIAFLLKLVDSLQDWERPNEDNKKGFSPDLYSISIENQRLIFEVKLPDRREKIENEILAYLDAMDIDVT